MKMNVIVAQFKRELWENRASFLWSQLIFGFLFYLSIVFFISTKFDFRDGGMVSIGGADPFSMEMIVSIYLAISWALQVIVFAVVILVYTHSTLFSDRKTREILFWHSMPVSETASVLTKLAMICILVPLAIFVVNLVGGFLFVVFLGVVNPVLDDIWSALFGLNVSVRLLGNSFEVVLLMLPAITWFLFCSAYARRSPVTISLSVPLGLSILDVIAEKYFGFTLLFNDVLKAYIQLGRASFKKMMTGSDTSVASIDLISSVGLQAASFALLFSALMIGAAIWLRNNRYEI